MNDPKLFELFSNDLAHNQEFQKTKKDDDGGYKSHYDVTDIGNIINMIGQYQDDDDPGKKITLKPSDFLDGQRKPVTSDEGVSKASKGEIVRIKREFTVDDDADDDGRSKRTKIDPDFNDAGDIKTEDIKEGGFSGVKVVCNLNGDVLSDDVDVDLGLSSGLSLDLEVGLEINERKLYMNNKLKERAKNFDDQLELLCMDIVEKKGLDEPSVFHLPLHDPFVCVGGIGCDVDGKINTASTVLEGSSKFDSARCRIHLNDLEEFSLFPGQAVAIEGINPTGKLLICKQVHSPPILPFPPSSLGAPLTVERLSVVVAAGPWNLKGSLNPGMVRSLTDHIAQNPPHLLVLTGPFLDSKQDSFVQSQEKYDALFLHWFRIIVERCRSFSLPFGMTRVVLVPSLQDLHHDPVFPQPPFNRTDLSKLDPNILHFPNPCCFSLDGVLFGLTSSDILKHLSSELLMKTRGTRDRLARICLHLIQQRSLYPLRPPHHDVPIDSSKSGSINFGSHTPNIIISPSDLAPFVKIVQGVCCINPGRISKLGSPGTFARITVHQPSSNNNVNPDNISSRTRVDIIRLS